MFMKNGKSNQKKRVVVLWVITISLVAVFLLSSCIIIGVSNQNKRIFVEDIVERIEEAKLYFQDKEGWEIEIKKGEGKSSLLVVTTEEGVEYVFRNGDNGCVVDRIEQKLTREEDGKILKGNLKFSQGDWNFTDIVKVAIDHDRPGYTGIKYSIPEFELIDDWGDPGEAELKLFEWVNKDKIMAIWNDAEVIVQKLNEFVELSVNAQNQEEEGAVEGGTR